MPIYTEILGNALHSSHWRERLQGAELETVYLDPWTAQKSRFVVTGDRGNSYQVALQRHTRLVDGDILTFSEHPLRATILRLTLHPVLVIELQQSNALSPEALFQTGVELGHALGNQHWPAVVKGAKVFVPLTVDRKVMQSVMETHRFEHLSYRFQEGEEVIPFLAPHEIRRLFGGAEQPHPGKHCVTHSSAAHEP